MCLKFIFFLLWYEVFMDCDGRGKKKIILRSIVEVELIKLVISWLWREKKGMGLMKMLSFLVRCISD